jgi:hypothetical protein
VVVVVLSMLDQVVTFLKGIWACQVKIPAGTPATVCRVFMLSSVAPGCSGVVRYRPQPLLCTLFPVSCHT